MENKSFKRRNYFLKDSPQPGLIVKTYLILFIIMLVSGVVFYFIGNKNLSREFFQAHSVIKTTMHLLLPSLILINLIAILGSAFMVINFTHSVAGPIYRLKHISEKVANGDLTLKVHFRKKDTIHQLAEIINHIIKGLHLRLKEFDGSLAKLRDLSEQINNLDKLSYDELAHLKKKLLAVSLEFEKEIEKFKL
ncbi:MAG: hypothetical protein COV72_02585 [Candidatus Omnitrophica bacterium CG11_big_fil_rev_8_21_14_0_20_42_13]|uniref:HAMP domain-containing protein n=1 Tax=Candidatus Ghiorseimicrobium undicola TaxID=1974746 RepID=A0A2H0LYM5_9BACT|nr:MAG: hypothetical protein COV72_02585 [Candidatus Omnitrophica bacterium CG11_big_fil_rev_8_21_14_0_20_42_13]